MVKAIIVAAVFCIALAACGGPPAEDAPATREPMEVPFQAVYTVALDYHGGAATLMQIHRNLMAGFSPVFGTDRVAFTIEHIDGTDGATAVTLMLRLNAPAEDVFSPEDIEQFGDIMRAFLGISP
jgi:ABC-type glycerol-3-phosphate transport system substrate-binding protein